jgi:hypothetical protein
MSPSGTLCLGGERKMAGEDAQDTGREGLQRARQWLSLTTRVKDSWTHSEEPLAELIHFQWPYGSQATFSFDLGGIFKDGDLDGQSFVAEVKNYRYEMDLPDQFLDFLAKCYVALEAKPARCDHFLWISWSPFQARSWHKHATTESVKKALAHPSNRKRVLDVDTASDAMQKWNIELMSKVASRIWLITLSDQQEKLVLTPSNHRLVKFFSEEQGSAS